MERKMVLNLEKYIGRKFPYARQLDTGAYIPIYKQLDAQILINHVEGTETVGTYLIKENGLISFAVVDIDCDYTITSPEEGEIFELSQIVYGLFKDFDRTLEFSGRRGYHIWIFLEKDEEPKFIRELIYSRLKSVGLRNIEVYPKQNNLDGKKLGNLIKLPCCIHKKSGMRSYIIKEDVKNV
jgi:hypothetical protein